MNQHQVLLETWLSQLSTMKDKLDSGMYLTPVCKACISQRHFETVLISGWSATVLGKKRHRWCLLSP
jgi:hypothetical protein